MPDVFALHKLAIANRRIAADSIKADKDRRQAAALILALAEIRPGALRAATAAAHAHHDKGLTKDVVPMRSGGCRQTRSRRYVGSRRTAAVVDPAVARVAAPPASAT